MEESQNSPEQVQQPSDGTNVNPGMPGGAVGQPKSFVVTVILSVVLGTLGIDRMYLGYVGIGILKLVTFGGFGIWWLIDLIMILTKKLEPKDGSGYDQ